MKNLVVFDVETTGTDKNKDQIVQFAAIKVDRNFNKLLDKLNLYIQPVGNYTISLQAYIKHGITPEFLKDKPYFSEVAQQIYDFFTDCDLLTFNGISFDNGFLATEFNRCGIEWSPMNYACYDAFAEERRRNGLHLEDVFTRYCGKTMAEAGLNAHDALSDVKATYAIFRHQQENLEYNPENIITDDNVLTLEEFNGEIQPVFTLGKYKGLPLSYVCKADKSYIQWAIGPASSFTKATKNFIAKHYDGIN